MLFVIKIHLSARIYQKAGIIIVIYFIYTYICYLIFIKFKRGDRRDEIYYQ